MDAWRFREERTLFGGACAHNRVGRKMEYVSIMPVSSPSLETGCLRPESLWGTGKVGQHLKSFRLAPPQPLRPLQSKSALAVRATTRHSERPTTAAHTLVTTVIVSIWSKTPWHHSSVLLPRSPSNHARLRLISASEACPRNRFSLCARLAAPATESAAPMLALSSVVNSK